MTDDELKTLIGSLAESQKETDRQIQATSKEVQALSLSQKETEKLLKETHQELKEMGVRMELSQKETDKQIKALALSQKETDRQQKETDRQQKETDRQQKETDRQLKETDKRLNELGRQIGGLGNKFGGFTEGLAFPSMKKLLKERFGMECVATRVERRQHGKSMEIDVIAYSNSASNEVYVVEVKSDLDKDALTQMLATLRRFPQFFPEHRDKALYGVLAFVDSYQEMPKQVARAGLYLASIHGDLFELQSEAGFTPKNFQGAGRDPRSDAH